MLFKLKIKSKVIMGAVKSTMNAIGEKLEEAEASAKAELEQERLALEEELKENDQIIGRLKEKQALIHNRIQKQQPELAEAKKRLDELTRIRDGYIEEVEGYDFEIGKLMERQTKLNKRNVEMYEELKELEAKKVRPVLPSNSPFEEAKLAETVRLTMHRMASQAGCSALFERSDKSLQYTFSLLQNHLLEGTYYLTVSSNPENSSIHLYKKGEKKDAYPLKIASGVQTFLSLDPQNQEEVSKVTVLALKELLSIEQRASEDTAV